MIIDYTFQQSAAEKLFTKLYTEHKHGLWLNANVGYGKTYIVGLALKELFAKGWFDNHRGVFPVLWITKATAVEQVNRVLLDEFNFDQKQIYALNYDKFRATLGQIWVKETTVVEFGQVRIDYVWNEGFSPKLFILDESQSIKNETSQQSQIFIAAGNIPEAYFVHVSATPFTRISESKAFVIHSRVPYTYGFAKDEPMNEKHWNSFSKEIAGGTSPTEYNKEACARLVSYMADYIVRVPHIKTKFRCTNSVQCIPITPEQKAEYDLAMQIYIEAVESILERDPPNGVMLMLVAFLMYRKKAEIIKAEALADAAKASLDSGKAPIIGCNFKVTLAKIVEILVNKHGLKREDISMIWGGVGKPVKGKSTATAILDYRSIEDSIEDLDLGPQNNTARQKEIDNFQEGRSKVCLFTLKAGGVALSLHHFREGQLPREGYFATTYSAIELLQALGRNHRINSISHTLNTIILFQDTVEEEHVFPILQAKLQCLNAIVGSREKWADITLAGKDYLRNKVKGVLGEEDEEDVEGFYGDEEREEELSYDKKTETKLLTNGNVEEEANQDVRLPLPEADKTVSISSGVVMEKAEEGNDNKVNAPQVQTLLPGIPVRTFQCKLVNYLPLWHKLPNKKACSPAAVDRLCQKYGADKPVTSATMTFIEKPNGKRCLIRVDNKNNYLVAYEND